MSNDKSFKRNKREIFKNSVTCPNKLTGRDRPPTSEQNETCNYGVKNTVLECAELRRHLVNLIDTSEGDGGEGLQGQHVNGGGDASLAPALVAGGQLLVTGINSDVLTQCGASPFTQKANRNPGQPCNAGNSK